MNTSPKQNVLYVLCYRKEGSVQGIVLSPSRGAQQFLISLLNSSGRWKGFSFYYKHKINCLLNEAHINLNLAHSSLSFQASLLDRHNYFLDRKMECWNRAPEIFSTHGERV